jgi:para-aminobenzoate synthetase/4-amino-4-deoxychorismate lyase
VSAPARSPLARPTAVIRDLRARGWLRFDAPIEVIRADRPEDVTTAIRAVDTAAARGLWAAGFVAYEAAPAFDAAIRVRPRDADAPPLAWFGLFDRPAVVESIDDPARDSGDATDAGVWTPDITRDEYDRAIARIRDHLRAGDTYQVNFTFRLRAAWTGDDAWPLFVRLAAAQQADCAAWIDTGRFAIASASPELFFALDGRQITCVPMKGTAPRGRWTAEDLGLADALHRSEKNRAENVMIVDMVRNDLGRICDVGSVRVPGKALFSVGRYPTLLQMTSAVTGDTSADLAGVFGALFPSASVTGAPKVRTTGLIADLESSPRGVYTGAIGVVMPGAQARFNVAIRTVVVDRERQRAEYGVGSGIVWDSDGRDEYAECLLKARIVVEGAWQPTLLETLRWSREGGYALLDRHLSRLIDSSLFFFLSGVDTAGIREKLTALAATFDAAPQVVRVVVPPRGEPTVTAAPFVPRRQPVRLALALDPIDDRDVRFFHKTTSREAYDAARAAHPDADDVILWNRRGELTETTISNLALEIDGQWWTPPVSSGLLAGTYRGVLLDEGRIRERVLTLDALDRCQGMAVVNSVRGWEEAVLARRPAVETEAGRPGRPTE